MPLLQGAERKPTVLVPGSLLAESNLKNKVLIKIILRAKNCYF